MKNVVRFILFIIYSTCIFFLPNNNLILFFVFVNIGILFINKLSIRKAAVLDVQNDSQLYEPTKLNFIAPEKSCNFSEAIKKVYAKSLKAVPFILFTFTINCILDTFYNALWIGLKLFIVCNITIIYSETTSIIRFSRYNKNNVFST